ncbi:MAG: class II fructose-bisphosphate aldolase [Nanoarchaeota archaeon]
MVLVNPKKYFADAIKKKYAISHFNFYNLETAFAILNASLNQKGIVILGVSEKAIEYAGIENLVSIAKNTSKLLNIKTILHLDHGRDEKIIKDCIKKGFTSVMVDGSNLDFNENVKLTKKIVNFAKKYNVFVEAELGQLKGVEDGITSTKNHYTDPNQAELFVKKTNCDSLAIAIGTSHGAYKFKGKANLKFDILKDIRKRLKIPLVLHGASSVYSNVVKIANKYGANLGNVKGVSDSDLKKAVLFGIQKINTDTDLRLSFNSSIRKNLKLNPTNFDPRFFLTNTILDMQKICEHKINILNGKNTL